jgi:hypothetical protein
LSLPIFPEWAPITHELRPEMEDLLKSYLRYSDFNYVNLHSWDTGDTGRVTNILGNLAVAFPDYVTEQPVLSLAGDGQTVEAADLLLDWARQRRIPQQLELIPEEVATTLRLVDDLQVIEDIDNHDYVISINEVSAHHGKRFESIRYACNRFERKYGEHVDFGALDIENVQTQDEMKKVFLSRELGKSANDHIAELAALGRLFENAKHYELGAFGLWHLRKLIGFIVYEPLEGEWALGHFWKADVGYDGVYPYLMTQTCCQLKAEGVKYFNIEQDLGLAGLRQAKGHFRPVAMLKKYIVRPSADAP